MRYTLEDITLNDIVCTIELELDIACYSEEIEIEDFTVLSVEFEDDITGELTAIKDTNKFQNDNCYAIQSAIDDDNSLMNQIEDYLKEGEGERDIERYEESLNEPCSMAENIMFSGMDY